PIVGAEEPPPPGPEDLLDGRLGHRCLAKHDEDRRGSSRGPANPGRTLAGMAGFDAPGQVRLRLAYWIAQVCNADALDHRRVAEDDWRAGEAVEKSNSGTKQN